MSAASITLMDHLRELRRRLIWSVVVVGIGATFGYIFRAAIIAFLQWPLHEPLYYTSPTGSFEFVMQVCLLVGFLIALPVVLYNALRFVEPALPRRFSRLELAAVVGLSFSLAVGGAAFGYYVSLPAAFRFFNSVGTSHLHPLISSDQYFRFVVAYLGTFALIFQLPLILLLIDRIKPMGPRQVRKWRKVVIVGAFAIAIITPSAPDPLSQVILAMPMILLYEATLLYLTVRGRRRSRRAARTQRIQEQVARSGPASVVHERKPAVAVADVAIGPPFYRPRSKIAVAASARQALRASGEAPVLDLRHHSLASPGSVLGPILDLRDAAG